MMRIKVMLLAVLAVMVGSAVLAASASATFTLTTEECKEEMTGLVALCDEVEGKLLALTGTETFTANIGASDLEAVIGEKVLILCTGGSLVGTPTFAQVPLTEALKATKFAIDFTGCTLDEPTSCKVEPLLETKELKAVFGDEDPVAKVTFEPAVAGPFIEIKFSGATCPSILKATVKKVTGVAPCVNVNPKTVAAAKEVSCNITKADKKLFFGEEPAAFTATAKIELTSKLAVALSLA